MYLKNRPVNEILNDRNRESLDTVNPAVNLTLPLFLFLSIIKTIII